MFGLNNKSLGIAILALSATCAVTVSGKEDYSHGQRTRGLMSSMSKSMSNGGGGGGSSIADGLKTVGIFYEGSRTNPGHGDSGTNVTTPGGATVTIKAPAPPKEAYAASAGSGSKSMGSKRTRLLMSSMSKSMSNGGGGGGSSIADGLKHVGIFYEGSRTNPGHGDSGTNVTTPGGATVTIKAPAPPKEAYAASA